PNPSPTSPLSPSWPMFSAPSSPMPTSSTSSDSSPISTPFRKAKALYACKAEHDSELSFTAGTVFDNAECPSASTAIFTATPKLRAPPPLTWALPLAV
ncbi:ARHGAP26 isoform 20, partial [Pan troglodytes]